MHVKARSNKERLARGVAIVTLAVGVIVVGVHVDGEAKGLSNHGSAAGITPGVPFPPQFNTLTPSVEYFTGLRYGEKITDFTILRPETGVNFERKFVRPRDENEVDVVCFITSNAIDQILANQSHITQESAGFGYLITTQFGSLYISAVEFNKNTNLITEFTPGQRLNDQVNKIFPGPENITSTGYEVFIIPGTDNDGSANVVFSQAPLLM